MVPRHGRRRSAADLIRLSVAGSALAVLVALAPMPAAAQTPNLDADSNLLTPSLEGNPDRAPTFTQPSSRSALPPDQAPPIGKFTPPPPLQTPVYGSPTGFGAGDTGFDSSNAPHRRRVAQTPASSSDIAPPQQMTFDQVTPQPPQVPSTV